MIKDSDYNEEDDHCVNFEEAESLIREFFSSELIDKYFSNTRLSEKSEGLKIMATTIFEKQPDIET